METPPPDDRPAVAPGPGPAAPLPHPVEGGTAPAVPGMVRTLGERISDVTHLPRIDDVPVREILTSGLRSGGAGMGVEDAFAVGTPATTPSIADIAPGWPRPRVFWRILALTAATYLLLRVAVENTGNALLLPGMIVIGAFIVPLSVVVFFLEMNSPRNVSVYQLGKMTLWGGALGILLTLLVGRLFPGSGVGAIIPAILTGVVEETGKMLALLAVVNRRRYPWQLNGALFGAAIGAGFAGLESAGYAFSTLFDRSGFDMFDSIMLRSLLAPGGHVIWTAMIGAALWEVKGDGPFQAAHLLHPTVVRRWAVAVALHGLWDTRLITFSLVGVPLQQLILSLLGWYIVFAVLKQAVAQVDQAREAATAGPPR